MKTLGFQSRSSKQGPRNLALTLTLAAVSLAGVASAQTIRTTVDDNLVTFADVQPMMSQGRVMVPVRGVFEYMNASVVWDANSRTVTAQRGTDVIRLPINSNYASVNGNQMRLDAPASITNGRTMVPLRFLSEALGASVEWIASTRTVEIVTTGTIATIPPALNDTVVAHMSPGIVIPFTLNTKLSSNASRVGDRFTAPLDTSGADQYNRLPKGTTLEGRVSAVSAKIGDTPGALGLEFDRITLPDGSRHRIDGVLHGLDGNSVTTENGKLVAKASSKKDDLKYVGYGAGAGALVSVLTKGNLLTDSLIGGALGYLFGTIDKAKVRDVALDTGTRFGVRLTNDLAFRVPADGIK
ncbi:MAG: copper amine oxidase N-terminal domain-containing protein [Fimbriimonadaceae bacterium]|nr:copper amine oxidase N-terminal domain-containing protein [Fimbriimonadaceae bacterium]